MAKRDITISEFCGRYSACDEGEKWALRNCKTMREVWEKAPGEYLLWVARRPNVLNLDTLTKFAVYCAERVAKGRNVGIVAAVEAFLEGDADALTPTPWTPVPLDSHRYFERVAVLSLASGVSLGDPSRLSLATYYTLLSVPRRCASNERRVQAVWLRKNAVPDFSRKSHCDL